MFFATEPGLTTDCSFNINQHDSRWGPNHERTQAGANTERQLQHRHFSSQTHSAAPELKWAKWPRAVSFTSDKRNSEGDCMS